MMMSGSYPVTVEVFKTNVEDRDQADWIVDQIQICFNNYLANFDLQDCDRILVVKSIQGAVRSSDIIELLKRLDYSAEVLPDD